VRASPLDLVPDGPLGPRERQRQSVASAGDGINGGITGAIRCERHECGAGGAQKSAGTLAGANLLAFLAKMQFYANSNNLKWNKSHRPPGSGRGGFLFWSVSSGAVLKR
jgi:hypothetical protein